jgi:hypothetical protein
VKEQIGKGGRMLVIYLVAMLAILVVSCALTVANAQTVGRNLVLTWQAPTTCAGGSALTNCPILGYSVQKNISGTWTEVGTTVASVRTFTHQNQALGTHTYRVVATSDAGPSGPSNETSRIIDVPGAPGSVVITVTVTVTP